MPSYETMMVAIPCDLDDKGNGYCGALTWKWIWRKSSHPWL